MIVNRRSSTEDRQPMIVNRRSSNLTGGHDGWGADWIIKSGPNSAEPSGVLCDDFTSSAPNRWWAAAPAALQPSCSTGFGCSTGSDSTWIWQHTCSCFDVRSWLTYDD